MAVSLCSVLGGGATALPDFGPTMTATQFGDPSSVAGWVRPIPRYRPNSVRTSNLAITMPREDVNTLYCTDAAILGR
jgi:hypothetical protein